MQALMQANAVEMNLHCHYQKQTYRNRCTIYGANGRLNLTIPIQHTKAKQRKRRRGENHGTRLAKTTLEVLESAYRSSPFFEFYEDELQEVFFQRPKSLMKYNLNLLQCLMEWLALLT